MRRTADLFDRDIMRASVPRFLELYGQRPIRDNPIRGSKASEVTLVDGLG